MIAAPIEYKLSVRFRRWRGPVATLTRYLVSLFKVTDAVVFGVERGVGRNVEGWGVYHRTKHVDDAVARLHRLNAQAADASAPLDMDIVVSEYDPRRLKKNRRSRLKRRR